jgi:hypothetical protein
MKRLPLSIQTLYADLLQSVTFSPTIPGSLSKQTIRGRTYLYATERHGAKRLRRYLGPADDPNVVEQAEIIRLAAEEAKVRRKTVSMLKRYGVPTPPVEAARLLESVANAGLFRKGAVLVGTGAYQIYPPVLGVSLSFQSMTTQDLDLAIASLAVTSDREGESLLDILRRADPSFVAQMGLNSRALPNRFRSARRFEVDVVTRYRHRADEEHPIIVKGLQCSAQPFRYLEYLVAEPITAVALYGSGVEVLIPQPARYAVHKLIVAQLRTENSPKRAKDLAQARELIEALNITDPKGITEAIADGRRRGSKWKTHLDRSLRQIGSQ